MKRAGHNGKARGRAPWTLWGGDAHSPGPRKGGPDVKTLYHTYHAVTIEVQEGSPVGGRQGPNQPVNGVQTPAEGVGSYRSTKTRAIFPRSTGPIQPWPSFFSAAEERSCRLSSNHQL